VKPGEVFGRYWESNDYEAMKNVKCMRARMICASFTRCANELGDAVILGYHLSLYESMRARRARMCRVLVCI